MSYGYRLGHSVNRKDEIKKKKKKKNRNEENEKSRGQNHRLMGLPSARYFDLISVKEVASDPEEPATSMFHPPLINNQPPKPPFRLK